VPSYLHKLSIDFISKEGRRVHTPPNRRFTLCGWVLHSIKKHDDNAIAIEGWAFMENKINNLRGNRVILVTMLDHVYVFNTKRTLRHDVANFLQ
jgi:hypothetical protein